MAPSLPRAPGALEGRGQLGLAALGAPVELGGARRGQARPHRRPGRAPRRPGGRRRRSPGARGAAPPATAVPPPPRPAPRRGRRARAGPSRRPRRSGRARTPCCSRCASSGARVAAATIRSRRRAGEGKAIEQVRELAAGHVQRRHREHQVGGRQRRAAAARARAGPVRPGPRSSIPRRGAIAASTASSERTRKPATGSPWSARRRSSAPSRGPLTVSSAPDATASSASARV